MSGAIVKLKPGRLSNQTRLPFVLINMSMTADGKITTANRRVMSFGSRYDLAHLYELRATADAVMCGARTVQAGEVTLGTGGPKYRRQRARRGLAAYPLRVVVSGSGAVNPRAPVFRKPFSPIVVLTTQRAAARQLAKLREVAAEVVVSDAKELDWQAALAYLRERWGVMRLLCEGGGELNDALFRAGLVDELHLTICPFVFGGRSAPTIAEGMGVEQLADATHLRLKQRRRVGDELFCVFERR